MTWHHPPSASQDPSGPHWYEFSTGTVGRLYRSLRQTISAFATGLAISFTLVLVIGFIGEEGHIARALSDAGMDPTAVARIELSVDFLARMTLAPMLVLTYLCVLGWCLLRTLEDVATSKSIITHIGAGAPDTVLPPPEQVHAVIKPRLSPWSTFLLVNAWTLLGFAVFMLIFAIAEGYNDMLAVAVALIAGALLFAAAYVFVRNNMSGAHRERREVMRSYFSAEAEEEIWKTARENSKDPSAAEDAAMQDPRIRLGNRILGLAGTLSGLVFILFMVCLFVLYPQARRYGPTGPRAQYGTNVETLIEYALWATGALLILTLAATLIGHLMQGAGYTAERKSLRSTLVHLSTTRPSLEMLRRYSGGHPVRSAQVLAAFAGMFATYGPAIVFLGGIHTTGFYSRSVDLFGEFLPIGFAMSGASVVLFVLAVIWKARADRAEQELRNDLLQRWPVIPPPPSDDEAGAPAKKGPALTVADPVLAHGGTSDDDAESD